MNIDITNQQIASKFEWKPSEWLNQYEQFLGVVIHRFPQISVWNDKWLELANQKWSPKESY